MAESDGDEVSPREFGEMKGSLSAMIQNLTDAFRSHAEASGRRVGLLEREFSEHRTKYEASEAGRAVERRWMITILGIGQALLLAVFGAWVKVAVEDAFKNKLAQTGSIMVVPSQPETPPITGRRVP